MTFEGFVANSKAIFESFPNSQIWLQGGFRPNRQLQRPEAGYCVVLRYDEKTTTRLSQFMEKVRAILPPLVAYDERSFHTTLGVHLKGDLKGFVPDRAVLKTLEKSVETGLRNRSENPAVPFEKWLFNNEALLVSGYPNRALWNLGQRIESACQENGVPLERGHILHVTTARFIHGVSRQVFEQFLSLMESAPVLGTTKPIAIDIATWRCDGLTFELDPHKRHNIEDFVG
jgi:hypothetical protein